MCRANSHLDRELRYYLKHECLCVWGRLLDALHDTLIPWLHPEMGRFCPDAQEPGEGGACDKGWPSSNHVASAHAPSTEELHGHCLADQLWARNTSKPGLWKPGRYRSAYSSSYLGGGAEEEGFTSSPVRYSCGTGFRLSRLPGWYLKGS